jgi:hypothetical protein
MTIIWFSDKDRQDMRNAREERIRRDTQFFEFLREREPDGVADRDVPPAVIDRMGLLDIRPWPDPE